MKFKYKIPKEIKKFIANSKVTEIAIGCSDSQVIKIETKDKVYYLKISESGELNKEFEKLSWLKDKLPVPKIILYNKEGNFEYLITEEIGRASCRERV